LGYPGGGDFTAGPAVVIESFKATGQDIYNQGKTTREVYSIKGSVQPGNSGGPLVNKEGDVIGVIFAESTTYDDVGYALTADSVIARLNTAKNRNTIVTTGGCTQ
jgi:S1-C subfamily serine protease